MSDTNQILPPFLQKDPNRPDLLHCTHPEAQGTFTLQRLTFARELERERIKGIQAGPAPTPDGMILAEWYAALKVGLKEVPKGFDLDNIEDEELIEALYGEVSAYLLSFRRQKQN